MNTYHMHTLNVPIEVRLLAENPFVVGVVPKFSLTSFQENQPGVTSSSHSLNKSGTVLC